MKSITRCLTLSALGLILSAGYCSGNPFLEGVDVSQADGAPDWEQLAADGRVFAFARVSDGLNHLDTSFAADYAGIQAAGMIRGSYQVFEPGQDPVAQADLLLAAIGPLRPGDLPPALDVEVTGGRSRAAIASEIQAWVTTVEDATGEVPIVYTGSSFWDNSVGSANFSGDPLWYAAPGIALPNQLPTGWASGDWQFWQYSEDGEVEGIPGAADLDRYNGNLGELDFLANVGQAPVPDDASVAPLLLDSLVGILFGLRRRGRLGHVPRRTLVNPRPQERDFLPAEARKLVPVC